MKHLKKDTISLSYSKCWIKFIELKRIVSFSIFSFTKHNCEVFKPLNEDYNDHDNHSKKYLAPYKSYKMLCNNLCIMNVAMCLNKCHLQGCAEKELKIKPIMHTFTFCLENTTVLGPLADPVTVPVSCECYKWMLQNESQNLCQN